MPSKDTQLIDKHCMVIFAGKKGLPRAGVGPAGQTDRQEPAGNLGSNRAHSTPCNEPRLGALGKAQTVCSPLSKETAAGPTGNGLF